MATKQRRNRKNKIEENSYEMSEEKQPNEKKRKGEEKENKQTIPKPDEKETKSNLAIVETNKNEKVEDFYDLSEVKDLKEFVLEVYKLKMPEDFYDFLDFCKSLNPNDPKSLIYLTRSNSLICQFEFFLFKMHSV